MPPDRVPRDAGTLLDIVNAGRRIREFVAEMGLDAFLKDAKTQSAVIHQVLVIGEATKRLSLGFRNEHPEIPWLDIAAMRNRLVHGYDDVDLNVMWDTATIHVPRLIEDIEPLLPPKHG